MEASPQSLSPPDQDSVDDEKPSGSGSGTASVNGDDASKKKRTRRVPDVVHKACARCRSLKSACDGMRPCNRCRRVNAMCVDLPPRKRGRKRGLAGDQPEGPHFAPSQPSPAPVLKTEPNASPFLATPLLVPTDSSSSSTSSSSSRSPLFGLPSLPSSTIGTAQRTLQAASSVATFSSSSSSALSTHPPRLPFAESDSMPLPAAPPRQLRVYSESFAKEVAGVHFQSMNGTTNPHLLSTMVWLLLSVSHNAPTYANFIDADSRGAQVSVEDESSTPSDSASASKTLTTTRSASASSSSSSSAPQTTVATSTATTASLTRTYARAVDSCACQDFDAMLDRAASFLQGLFPSHIPETPLSRGFWSLLLARDSNTLLRLAKSSAPLETLRRIQELRILPPPRASNSERLVFSVVSSWKDRPDVQEMIKRFFSDDIAVKMLAEMHAEQLRYSNIPFGAVIFPLYPREFTAYPAWVNNRQAAMLGFDTQRLASIMSHRESHYSVYYPGMADTVYRHFLRAISSGLKTYSYRMKYVHKHGHMVETIDTVFIRYHEGIPLYLVEISQYYVRPSEMLVLSAVPPGGCNGHLRRRSVHPISPSDLH